MVAIGAVRESGIIGHAQDSESKYSEAQEKEQIGLAISEWQIQKAIPENTKTFKEVITNELQVQNVSVTGEDNGPLTLTMQSGRQYMITNSGEFFIGWYDNGDGSYTKGDTTVKVGETTYTNAEVLAKLGIEASEYTGTYGKATRETWTVIGVEGDKIKLASTINVSLLRLGKEDLEAPTDLQEIYNKAGEDNLNLEKAIWSYNNALNRIQTAVERATKGMTGARSITIEDIADILNITEEQIRTYSSSYGRTYRYYYEGDAETGKVYNQYLDWNETDTEAGWSNKSVGSANIFISYDDKVIDGTNANKNNVVKLKINRYPSNLRVNTEFTNSLGKGNYWLASLFAFHNTAFHYAEFGLHWMNEGRINDETFFYSNGTACETESVRSACHSLHLKLNVEYKKGRVLCNTRISGKYER